MFISRFNRFFARHSRMLYLGLGIIISLSFVVFVTPGRGRGGMGRTPWGRGGRTAGTMYGRSISSKAFMQNLRLADLSNYLKSGEFMSQDSSQVGTLVQETLRRMRALHEAEKRGLAAVSQAELQQVLRRVFSRDGKFDKDLLRKVEEGVLFRNEYDGADLDEALRQNIIIARLDAEAAAAIQVSPNEVRDLYDQYNEQFVVSYAVVRGDTEKDGTPSEEEVAAYYGAHRSELRLPDGRRVRVAQFKTEDFQGKVTVEAKEVEDFYNRMKETAYKGKTLEQVKADIEGSLKQSKARVLAKGAAGALLEQVTKAVPTLEAKAVAEQFAKACSAEGIATKDSGPFLNEGVIPEIGKYPNLQRAVYALTEQKPLPEAPFYDAGTYFAACWLETIPGAEPQELDDTVRQQIRDTILAAEGRAYYEKTVEIYREPLAGCKVATDLTTWHDEQLAKETGLSAEEKEKRQQQFRETIQDDVAPYFTPLQKKIRAVVFSPAEFEKAVTISDEQIKGYYDEHLADFQKEEVHARQITVTLPPNATAEQKEQKRAALTKALDQVRAGTAFADVAKAVSEDPATKAKGGDLGYVSRGQLPPAVDEALFSLEVGQVSPILEAPGSLVVVKLEEKRAGRTLEDAQPEIRRKLLEQISLEKAIEAAGDFGRAAQDELDKAQGSAAVAADVFSKVAEAHSLTTKDSSYFSETGMLAPFGYDPELSKSFFKLTKEDPLSDAIKGRKDVLLGCWLETREGELPKVDGNTQLLERLKNKARRDRAKAAAHKRAEEAHAALAAALKEGKSFAEASKALTGIEFKSAEPFTRMQPPNDIPDARALLEKLTNAAPGTLLDPIDGKAETTLVYVESRQLPTTEKFEEERDRFDNMVRWSKRYGVVQEFYDKLEKESATTLQDPWKGMVERSEKKGKTRQL
jgi:parvulin-like peptidyl-prolyl isomerase